VTLSGFELLTYFPSILIMHHKSLLVKDIIQNCRPSFLYVMAADLLRFCFASPTSTVHLVQSGDTNEFDIVLD